MTDQIEVNLEDELELSELEEMLTPRILLQHNETLVSDTNN